MRACSSCCVYVHVFIVLCVYVCVYLPCCVLCACLPSGVCVCVCLPYSLYVDVYLSRLCLSCRALFGVFIVCGRVVRVHSFMRRECRV